MSIKVNAEDFREINRQFILRESDVKSVSDVAKEMRHATDEHTLLEIARRMLTTNDRNERARNNEQNVETLKELIVDLTDVGDMLTTGSVCHLLWEQHFARNSAKYGAVIAALDDLVKEEYLERRYMRKTNRRGTYVVYIVR